MARRTQGGSRRGWGVGRVLAIGSRLRAGWNRFWSWRRIEFSRGGTFFTVGAFAIGFAAINTGNNLLYLLLGAMLGFVAVSSWLSEQVIGGVIIGRHTPRGVTAGNPVRVEYEVENGRRKIPVFAIEIGENGLPERGFVPYLRAGGRTVARAHYRFARRGVVPLGPVAVSTSFPFGLFRKTRTVDLPGELVVWPRTDRPVPLQELGAGRHAAVGPVFQGPTGPRGEYRGLRGYRPGDDPRDIHWRTSARLGVPVVREYEQSVAETWWLCLDTRGGAGPFAEAAVEMAASLAARAVQTGQRFGFSSGGPAIEPGQGPGHLERILNSLARAEFTPMNPPPLPPGDPRHCVLVTLSPAGVAGFGAVIGPEREDTDSGGMATVASAAPGSSPGTGTLGWE